MFRKYYLKTIRRRLAVLALPALITFLLGSFFLSSQTVPAGGRTIENWLYYYYLCGAGSLLWGTLGAGIWFYRGLSYDALNGAKLPPLYYGLGLLTLAGGALIALAGLPAAYEFSLPAQLWLLSAAPLVYYFDSVFAGAYPVQFFPPYSRFLYERFYQRLAPEVLARDIRFQKDLFTAQLGLLPLTRENDGFLNNLALPAINWQGQPCQPLYPVEERILDFLDPAELEGRVRLELLEEASGPALLVRLTLPGADKRLAPLYLQKTYLAEDLLLLTKPPVLAAWPNFELTGLTRWSRYYTYYDDNEGSNLYLRPLKSWDLPDTLRRIETTVASRKEIHCGSSFPRAFVGQTTGSTQSCGLLLTAPPQSLKVTNKLNSVVSVDFGTTNTTICYALEEAVPGPMVLHNHLQSFFPLGKFQSCLSKYFLPAEESIGCAWIMSAFHSYNDVPVTRENLFQKGHIFFVNGFNALADLTNVTTDLKWDLGHRELTRGFLEQLCTQCLAELAAVGVTNIDWRFSYPKSFTVNEKQSYDQIRTQVLANLEQNTGSDAQPETRITCRMDERYLVPESIAIAAYYDRDYGADRSNGIVCLDIGGGSTDLAFWYGERPDITWQTSLRLAGRQIFRDVLFARSNVKLLQQLNISASFNHQLEELIRLAGGSRHSDSLQAKNAFGLKLDAFLKYHEEEINNAWQNGCRNSPGLKKLQQVILFALGGLLYYAGMVFGQQYKEGTFNHLVRFHAVYIGGNGSKLLDLAAGGHYGDSCPEYKILAQLFRDGIRCNLGEEAFESLMRQLNFKVITINKSRQPKQEVAYGLLYEETASIKALMEGKSGSEVNSTAVAGESFLEDEQPNKDGILTRQNLKHRLTVEPRLPVFKTFLKDFNLQTSHFLNYKLNIYSDEFLFLIRETVNKTLADKRLQTDNDLAVEPIFALALNRAVSLLADQIPEPAPKAAFIPVKKQTY